MLALRFKWAAIEVSTALSTCGGCLDLLANRSPMNYIKPMYRNIYIVSWRGHVSGGAETLHQLCSTAKSLGAQAYIVYFPLNPDTVDSLPERFLEYDIEVAQAIEDAQDCLCIVTEGMAAYFPFSRFRQIRFAFVWLSYDFVSPKTSHRKSITHGLPHPHIAWLFFQIKALLFHPRSCIKESLRLVPWKRFRSGINFCNCYYAYRELVRHGVKGPIGRLIGPVSDSFVSPTKSKKEDVVCFGVAKDSGFYKRILREYEESYPGSVEFISICGMTKSEVKAMLSRAKVYFDFGFFPGPERIPREAVLLGCNIVTGKYGAAGNPHDVPIPDKYKFAAPQKNYPQIVMTIHELVVNYELHFPEYNEYRRLAIAQVDSFIGDVSRLLQGNPVAYEPL